MKQNKVLLIIIGIISVCASIGMPVIVQSADTTPNHFVYEGRLLASNGDPIATAHVIRFSFWKSIDFVPSDKNENGSINTNASQYSGWNEVQTVTPNSRGIFSVELGTVTALPLLDFSLHKYLQVEVKKVNDPDTEYQLMDVTGDDGVDAIDRQTMGSSPYAKNAETIQNKTIGNNEGNIALVGQNNQWDPTLIPGATTAGTFILDSNNAVEHAGTGSIKLQFGKTLNKYVAYDTTQRCFYFNDDVHIDGNLIITGTLNGRNIDEFHAQNEDSGTSQSMFVINSSGNQLILSSAGLTGNRTITFPNANITVVGENTTQTITNKTIDGNNNTLQNIKRTSLAQRNESLTLIPQYPNMVIGEDGTSNNATINAGTEDGTDKPYYVLTSGASTFQDLDMVLTLKLPEGFVSWQTTPLQIQVKSSSLTCSNNALTVSMTDTQQNAVTLVNNANLCSATANVWETKTITWNGNPTWTAGETVTIRLKLGAKSNNRISIGKVSLLYKSQ